MFKIKLWLLARLISFQPEKGAKRALVVESSQHPDLRTALTYWLSKVDSCPAPMLETARKGHSGWNPRLA